jgi:hypothetical protein
MAKNKLKFENIELIQGFWSFVGKMNEDLSYLELQNANLTIKFE